jgi:hypothetical protein
MASSVAGFKSVRFFLVGTYETVSSSSGNTIEELTVRVMHAVENIREHPECYCEHRLLWPEGHKPASIMKGAILNQIRSVKLLLTYLIFLILTVFTVFHSSILIE